MKPKKPGRPVVGSKRRAMYFPPDVDEHLESIPKNKRSHYVTSLVRADMKRKKKV